MQEDKPPKIAERFLLWVIKEDLAEEVLGDLEEKFYTQLQTQSLFWAQVQYWYQVIHYLRPFALKQNIFHHLNPFFMFPHHFKLAYRNFLRDKGTFLINLTGLSTGLACFILIFLWVQDERSFDKFHQHDAHLHQVMQKLNSNKEDVLIWEHTPGPLSQTLRNDFPEVAFVTELVGLGNTGIIVKNDSRLKVKEKYAGKDFFRIFSFPLLEGQIDEVLSEKKNVLLSETLALKLFNRTENLIGETIEWQRNWANVSGDYIVAGVFKDLPTHSTIQFDLLFTYDLFFENKPELKKWNNSEARTYLVLKEEADLAQFNQKIEGLVKQHHEESESTLFTRPFSDRYLFGTYQNGVQTGGRITYVRLFSLIALFILLIACINFMNLSTARATQRLKEVGIKKTIGASRFSLVSQYLSESVLITFFALLVALTLVVFFLPQFNQITGKTLNLSLSPTFIISVLLISFFTGIIAGSYPALYLSGFEPVAVLKGKINHSLGEFWARKGLVVFQFTLSIILIVSVVVVYQQIQFIQSKNLGYDKENIILFHKDGAIKENMETFLNEVKKIPSITNASTIDGDMVKFFGYTTTVKWEGHQQDIDPIRFGVMIVGKDIIETLGMELKMGRNFSPEHGMNKDAYIFNEAAIEAMGLENPIGKTVQRRGQDHTIIGVVKNFHFESLYSEVKPCYLRLGTYGNNIVAKIQVGQEQNAIAQLEQLYTRFNPGLPFEFRFLDEDYQQLYEAEHRVATLSRYFAGMAILISCLGLFGLAAFNAQRRTKEIGIRKVLGASQWGIVRLLSVDFTKMVIVAILAALPLSYWIAAHWLESFAFKIDLKLWFFLGAGIAALLIAWLTVGVQTMRAASVNPVECLKME